MSGNLKLDQADIIKVLDERLRWLSAWTIHNANHLRESRDGVKAGGHQASCASMSTIMAALYFHALRPEDRAAVKPHGGPLLHAAHYLAGNQVATNSSVSVALAVPKAIHREQRT